MCAVHIGPKKDGAYCVVTVNMGAFCPSIATYRVPLCNFLSGSSVPVTGTLSSTCCWRKPLAGHWQREAGASLVIRATAIFLWYPEETSGGREVPAPHSALKHFYNSDNALWHALSLCEERAARDCRTGKCFFFFFIESPINLPGNTSDTFQPTTRPGWANRLVQT